MKASLLFVLFFYAVKAAPPVIPIHMSIQYTTDGDVTFNMMNITFETVQLQVTLLGCDYGYYDEYLIIPPKSLSWKTSVTPFHCLECVCENFEFDRVEPFVVVSTT
jgi:hypothetical protein